MYKKLITSILLAGSAVAVATAQVTLNAATINPIIGDQFYINTCDTGVSPQSGGASQSWDFTSLVTTSVDTVRAEIPAWTPHGSLFPSSNVALVSITASATSVDAYDLANDTVLTNYGLYYNTASQYLELTTPIDALQYPFTYLSSFTENFAGTALYMGITRTETGTVSVECDGWGTITLPGGTTYNAARVHSTQNFVDNVNLFGSGTSASYQLESYTWYSPGFHNAVLTIVTGDGPGGNFKTVTYSAFQDPTHEGVSSVTNTNESLDVFPNPVKDELNIRYATVNNESVYISLSDMLGREVAVIANSHSQGTQQLSYNTAGLPAGIYLVRFQTASQTITRKVEVQ